MFEFHLQRDQPRMLSVLWLKVVIKLQHRRDRSRRVLPFGLISLLLCIPALRPPAFGVGIAVFADKGLIIPHLCEEKLLVSAPLIEDRLGHPAGRVHRAGTVARIADLEKFFRRSRKRFFLQALLPALNVRQKDVSTVIRARRKIAVD
ncbi:MAG: hypothetical protein K9M51_02995 [Candidatus Gracilibacteria bacterium]|nr:hypothetical protein [Candidatus Gracilibacteria bacterium]